MQGLSKISKKRDSKSQNLDLIPLSRYGQYSAGQKIVIASSGGMCWSAGAPKEKEVECWTAMKKGQDCWSISSKKKKEKRYLCSDKAGEGDGGGGGFPLPAPQGKF